MDSGESEGVPTAFQESSDFVTMCSSQDVNNFGSQYLPAFYFTMFLLSLLGNGLVLCTIFKYEKLNTVTNIFLLNLVASDLVFSSSLPFWATYHSSEWIFGRALCKLVGGVYFVGFYSSILFLTLMTFDRYLAVVHPVSTAKTRKNRYALVSSAAVWVVSILATVKEFVALDVNESEDYGLLCESTDSSDILDFWNVVGDYQQFLFFFLFPLAVVMYCYVRIIIRIMNTRMSKKCRTIKIIFVILIMFFFCWTPYNIVVLIRVTQTTDDYEIYGCSEPLDYALYISRNLSYLYFCINPVFYTFVGKKFRNHFHNLLAKHSLCFNNQMVTSHSSRTSSQRSPESMYE